MNKNKLNSIMAITGLLAVLLYGVIFDKEVLRVWLLTVRIVIPVMSIFIFMLLK